MYKIMLTVRNRLSVTKKAIHALKYHSKIPHQIYIYDNLTNYKLDEHFYDKYIINVAKNTIILLHFIMKEESLRDIN